MTADTSAPRRRCPDVPHHAWYAAATSRRGRPRAAGRQVLGTRIALYRTDATAGRSPWRTAASTARSRSAAGTDARATTSSRRTPGSATPPTARASAVPDAGPGALRRPGRARTPSTTTGPSCGSGPETPGLAPLRPPPDTAWLRDPAWATFGDAWDTAASIRLLLDNFSDITHVAHVDPEIAPPALGAGQTPPPLEVMVSETTMRFSRDYPPAPVADWHAALIGVPPASAHSQREEGEFCSPGLWVDRWHVAVAGTAPPTARTASCSPTR